MFRRSCRDAGGLPWVRTVLHQPRCRGVLYLLELRAQAGREMSHSDISETLEIPKSSLTQLLKNLQARGYVETTPNGRGYRLGDALLSLSESTGQIRNLASHAEAVLSD